MSRLKWHPEGFREWGAWSTVDGTFTRFEFKLVIRDLSVGFGLTIFDTQAHGIAPYGLPIFRAEFQHREWTEQQMFDWVEMIRPMLPEFEGHQEWTSAEILERDRRRREQAGQPTRCQFVHVFPRGAADDTACLCGKVTNGFYRDLQQKSA